MLAVVCRTVLATAHLLCSPPMSEADAIQKAFETDNIAEFIIRDGREPNFDMSSQFVVREHDIDWEDALAASKETAERKAAADKRLKDFQEARRQQASSVRHQVGH